MKNVDLIKHIRYQNEIAIIGDLIVDRTVYGRPSKVERLHKEVKKNDLSYRRNSEIRALRMATREWLQDSYHFLTYSRKVSDNPVSSTKAIHFLDTE